MTLIERIVVTILVMGASVFPLRKGRKLQVMKPFFSEAGHFQVAGNEISGCLAHPDQWITQSGELTLLFAGCLALAAPFILFRLKRKGFSNCRVISLPEGLLLQARR